MITFSNRLYISNSIKENKVSAYKLGIRQGRGFLKLYLLALPANGFDQLEIFHNSLFKQRLYRKLDVKIVGITKTREEALSLLNDILLETIETNGNANIRDYLLKDFDKNDNT